MRPSCWGAAAPRPSCRGLLAAFLCCCLVQLPPASRPVARGGRVQLGLFFSPLPAAGLIFFAASFRACLSAACKVSVCISGAAWAWAQSLWASSLDEDRAKLGSLVGLTPAFPFFFLQRSSTGCWKPRLMEGMRPNPGHLLLF